MSSKGAGDTKVDANAKLLGSKAGKGGSGTGKPPGQTSPHESKGKGK
jgi:hypothetical protein